MSLSPFTSRRFIYWSVSMHLMSNQFNAHTRLHREYAEKVHGSCKNKTKQQQQQQQKTSVLQRLLTSDTNRFHESLNWCRQMPNCWHSSAYSCEIFSNNFHLTVSRRFVKYPDKQLENVKRYPSRQSPTKSLIWHFIIHYLKSVSVFRRQKKDMFNTFCFLELLRLSAWA